MKKLMILAAAVVATVAANAAAITWGSGTVYKADTTKAGKGDVAAYLFLIDATTYGTLAASANATALSDAVYGAYGSSLASANANGATTAKGIANLSDPTDYKNGDTAYAAILYVEGDNYMGNVATYTLTSDMDASVGGLSSLIGGIDGNPAPAWSTAAVPEPTSGLLMLLGMAGLALRRRRA